MPAAERGGWQVTFARSLHGHFSQPCSQPRPHHLPHFPQFLASVAWDLVVAVHVRRASCPRQATLPDPSHSQRETNSVELEASASTVTLCFAFTAVSTDGSGMARVFQILIINYMVSSIGCCVLGPMEDSSHMLGQGKCCFQHMLIYFHD